MSSDLPEGVRRDLGTGGLVRYAVSNPWCDGEIFELGATVTRWAPTDQTEVLWLSAESAYQPGRPIRGGIPICAPWFGAGRGTETMPQNHGFVRTALWHLVAAQAVPEATELVFELNGAEVAESPGADRYPSDLIYRYRVRFGRLLQVELSITSPTASFILDEALHTYLAVSDIRSTRIHGLDGVPYLDKTSAKTDDVQRGDLIFTGETDRVYTSAPVTQVIDGDRVIQLRPSGSATTVIWNPWQMLASQMKEFGDQEWQTMVCVETANALDQAVPVDAGTTTTMGVAISLHKSGT